MPLSNTNIGTFYKKFKLILKIVYVVGEEGVSCIYTPAPAEWEIDLVLGNEGGRVTIFKFPLRQDKTVS